VTGKNQVKTAVLTISTSCFRDERKNLSGPVLEDLCREAGFDVVGRGIVPDNAEMIREKLLFFCDNQRVDIVLTTGGTGPGPYDITPEATADICERLLPGISELVRAEGGKKTRRAYLSRGVSGIRGRTLIINLPGSPGAVRESMAAIGEIIPHALDMIAGGGHD